MLDERAVRVMQARTDAASDGPWRVERETVLDELGNELEICWVAELYTIKYEGHWYMERHDAEFAAQVREDMPALLTDRQRLLERIQELETKLARSPSAQ